MPSALVAEDSRFLRCFGSGWGEVDRSIAAPTGQAAKPPHNAQLNEPAVRDFRPAERFIRQTSSMGVQHVFPLWLKKKYEREHGREEQ